MFNKKLYRIQIFWQRFGIPLNFRDICNEYLYTVWFMMICPIPRNCGLTTPNQQSLYCSLMFLLCGSIIVHHYSECIFVCYRRRWSLDFVHRSLDMNDTILKVTCMLKWIIKFVCKCQYHISTHSELKRHYISKVFESVSFHESERALYHLMCISNWYILFDIILFLLSISHHIKPANVLASLPSLFVSN